MAGSKAKKKPLSKVTTPGTKATGKNHQWKSKTTTASLAAQVRGKGDAREKMKVRSTVHGTKGRKGK